MIPQLRNLFKTCIVLCVRVYMSACIRACMRACVCCPGGPQEVWNQGELEGVELQAL